MVLNIGTEFDEHGELAGEPSGATNGWGARGTAEPQSEGHRQRDWRAQSRDELLPPSEGGVRQWYGRIYVREGAVEVPGSFKMVS